MPYLWYKTELKKAFAHELYGLENKKKENL